MPNLEISQDVLNGLADALAREGSFHRVDPTTPGDKLFIRTVTYHLVGRVVGQIGEFIELADASCVFDSGSLKTAIANGSLTTTEFVGKMFVNRNSITDMFPWKHELPK